MAQDWYALIGGSVRGPLDAQTLKTLADKGQLKTSDQVRRGHDGPWVPARQVNGLLTDTSADNPDQPDSYPPTPAEHDKRPRGVSLRTATRVAIVFIILALALDVIRFLLFTIFGGIGFVSSNWYLMDRLTLYVGFGGLLFFLLILRSKQSR